MSDDIQLPELPDYDREGVHTDGFSGIAMARYACAAVLADRERRAQPAPGAQYFALEKDGHIQLDTRTNQLEIYETEQSAKLANVQHGSRYTVLKIIARRADTAAHSGKSEAHG